MSSQYVFVVYHESEKVLLPMLGKDVVDYLNLHMSEDRNLVLTDDGSYILSTDSNGENRKDKTLDFFHSLTIDEDGFTVRVLGGHPMDYRETTYALFLKNDKVVKRLTLKESLSFIESKGIDFTFSKEDREIGLIEDHMTPHSSSEFLSIDEFFETFDIDEDGFELKRISTTDRSEL